MSAEHMTEWHYERLAHQQETLMNSAIAAASKAAGPQTHPDFDGVHCLECDSEIPQQRLAMGRIYCVPCQSLKER